MTGPKRLTRLSPRSPGERIEAGTSRSVEAEDFTVYQHFIMHQWMRTLTVLAAILVPSFIILDFVMMPAALVPLFAALRLVSTVLIVAQAVTVRVSGPGKSMYYHGYFICFQIGFTISLMTNFLGGFDSSYYSGLILVIMGVNLLMPWKAVHTGLNSGIAIFMYCAVNVIVPHRFDATILLNNLFFLVATSVIAMSINHARYRLIRGEFKLLVELKKTKDSLWSEMELAKKIQTSLLPRRPQLKGYQVAEIMIPAKEVGGDYYDVIETGKGERWVAIGDVTGHGVDSGLITMMAHACIMTLLKSGRSIGIRDVLSRTNAVLREDIARLGLDRYLTIMLLRLEDDKLTVAGHHQDLLLYRAKEKRVSVIETKGTWLGIADDIGDYLETKTLPLSPRDAVLLFTDGATECKNESGEMYGQARLAVSFQKHAGLAADMILKRLLADIGSFQKNQDDDITMIVLKKDGSAAGRNADVTGRGASRRPARAPVRKA